MQTGRLARGVSHVYLEPFCNGSGAHVVCLIEALARLGITQHVLVSSRSMAGRLSDCRNVTVGPLVSSPITSYCLIPKVDILHVHDESGGRAGLLLTLTRATPFVMTRRGEVPPCPNPLSHSIYRRAASLICNSAPAARALRDFVPATPVNVIPDIVPATGIDREALSDQSAAEHLRVYQHAIEQRHG
jgi:glycosyl transferase family 4